MIKEDVEWNSIHIHYNGNIEKLLSEAIYPSLQKAEISGKLKDFFFIRYWLMGPHIRLRISSQRSSDSEVTKEITQQIEAYIAKRPSIVPFNITSKKSLDEYYSNFRLEFNKPPVPGKYFDNKLNPRLVPNNSVVLEKYELELSRYGGVRGMEISQKFFSDSSRLILQLTTQGKLTSRRERFGKAFQIMLVTLSEFLADEASIRLYTFQHYKYWSKFQTKNGELESYADAHFRVEDTVDFCRAVIHKDHITDWDESWRASCQVACNDLESAAKNGEIDASSFEPGLYDANFPNPAQTAVSRSYIHMNNNRLGIYPTLEAYTAYCLHKSLTYLSEETES